MASGYNLVIAAYWPETGGWTDDERICGLYLLTCEHRKTEGLYRLPDAYAAEDLCWDVERFRAAVVLLERRGWALRDGVWMLLAKALRIEQNRPRGTNQVKGAVRAVESAPRDSVAYAAFYAAAAEYCPDLHEALQEPIRAAAAPLPPAPSEAPSKGLPDPFEGANSTSTSSSTSTSCGGERAPDAEPVPPAALAPTPTRTCPVVVRDMLLAAEFNPAEIDHADHAIRLTLNQLRDAGKLPDDIDWPAFAKLIVRYRDNGKLTRHGPCPALRFVAKSADGAPRLSDPKRAGRRSPVGHYAAMRQDTT